MTASHEKRHLSPIPDLPRERHESLRARFGEQDDEQLDQLMRQEFGGKVLDIVCNELFIVDNRIRPGAVSIDHQGHHVAGLYLGVERVLQRHIPATSNPVVPLEIIDTRGMAVAVFSTGMGPLFTELSEEEIEKVDRNDTGVASTHQRIGLALDEPVTFGPLADRWAEADKVAPPTLRVVD